MREPVVKILLFLTAVSCLAVGGVFLLLPAWFVELSGSESVNLGWLRSVGALLALGQGYGLLLASFRRRDTNPLLAAAALSITAVTVALWYSFFAGELTAAVSWTVVVPALVSTLAAFGLWAAWVSRRGSLASVGGRPSTDAPHQEPADRAGAADPPADQPAGPQGASSGEG